MSVPVESSRAGGQEKPFFLGVDVGGTNVKCGLVDAAGQTLAYKSMRTEQDRGADDAKRVQLDVAAGPKRGPIGEAYAYQLTYPLHRREALTTILEPNLTVRPAALIVPALEQRNLRQANMIYGPTQAAVGKAIVDGLAEGWIPEAAMDDEVMMVVRASRRWRG